MTAPDPTPARKTEIDRHLTEALGLAATDRVVYLDWLALRDRDLARRVRHLLALAERPDPRLEPGRWAAGPLWSELAGEPAEPPPVDERIGPYRIVEEIGRGGMSIVYLAERVDGLFEQRVAVKYLSSDLHGSGLRRFERERRILAGLSHPGIARLLDGGTDRRGRPYIVMEHVPGEPIDRFVAATDADLDRRLELFRLVADAVRFAHRNLVVHRDLKPSNVLVTPDGRVRLLDFGIARLLEPLPTGEPSAPPTRSPARVLTPEYASPEQIRGDRVTTASDVYQLGVLLYELLSGRRPHRLEKLSLGEIERRLAGPDPPPPSVAAAGSRSAGDAPRALARRLRGDLDNVVMKAMAKDPEQRYASVGEMLEDLWRFRSGLPVRARRPSIGYRAGKFVRRHRAGVAAAVILATVLLGYGITVTAQARRIAKEAARTEQVKALLASLFVPANPGVSKGSEPTASELVADGARRIALELRDQPDIQSEMMTLLGEVYLTMGRYEEAAGQLRRALETRRRSGAPDAAVSRTARLLGEALHYQGRYREAERVLREDLPVRSRAFGERSREVGLALSDLGDLLHSLGELAEAEDVLRRALAIQTAGGGDDSEPAARARRDLANVLRDRGAYGEAERLYRRSLAASLGRLGPVDPIVSYTRAELARLLAETGGHDEAETLLEESLAAYATLYPGGHAMQGVALRTLGILRLRQDRPAEARAVLTRAIGVLRRTLSDRNALIPRAERYLAEALLATEEVDGAAALAERVVVDLRARGVPAHPAVADALETLGRARLRQDRPLEAVRLLERALASRDGTSVATDPRLAPWRATLATARERARLVSARR